MWSEGDDATIRERRGPWAIRIFNLRNCKNVDNGIFSCLPKFVLLSVIGQYQMGLLEGFLILFGVSMQISEERSVTLEHAIQRPFDPATTNRYFTRHLFPHPCRFCLRVPSAIHPYSPLQTYTPFTLHPSVIDRSPNLAIHPSMGEGRSVTNRR